LGYMNEMRVSRYYRDSIINSVGGGATEVMLDYLARKSGLR
ncbi:MAG: acyl-CoA dehydrogenase, partial [Deltaproteobacteria bacterium]|nr:acyl-CoA dehydrogenase [Deltaproteobacteria bacterium]